MRRIRTTAAIVSFSATVLIAPLASAGGCPTCTTDAECKAISADGVCVLWNEDPGCGGQLMLCCPGQGCGIDGNGMPSCIATGKCKLAGAAGSGGSAGTGGSAGAATGGSAGAATGGSAGTASGGTTSGTGGSVSGTGAAPAGNSEDDGGCGCRVGDKRTPAGLAFLLASVAVLLRRRRH